MLSMLKMQFDSFFNYAKVVIFEQNLAEPNKTGCNDYNKNKTYTKISNKVSTKPDEVVSD